MATDEQSGFYEQKGKYRISWAGPEDARIYTAWFNAPWHQHSYVPLGYFREGTDAEKHEAARVCCRENWELRQAG